eukprot:scaffold72176_cov68-Phaeocystis_antarctica.AAC.2
MDGADSTVMPSAAEAAAAVPRVDASEVCSTAAVVSAGTAMVAVMITLASPWLASPLEAIRPLLEIDTPSITMLLLQAVAAA